MSEAGNSEVTRLNANLSEQIDSESLSALWSTTRRVISDCRSGLIDGAKCTVMVLGYVQSGKTTAISSLMAMASDEGVDIVVALLGTTTLLVDQNAKRLSSAMGIQSRDDYQWTEIRNPASKVHAQQIGDWVSKGRTVFIPILKHAKRIDAVSSVLSDPRLFGRRILIIDDEADQASLNTQVKEDGESRTFQAIGRLRSVCSRHAFVQFTATPYALLLLEESDPLYPDSVEILEPGRGYTGGRQFFVDSRDDVIKSIPLGDEQGTQLPIGLPKSLREALADFLVGAGELLARNMSNAPISMLVHPSAKTSVQERYRFLIQNYLEDLRELVSNGGDLDALPPEFIRQRNALRLRVPELATDEDFNRKLRLVIREVNLSVLNSTSSLQRINWNETPVHILIGGNKLDRGFTVEGLTVTYMNRPASDQVDTTEQRARAFGYRREYLPFCQFYASTRTINLLTDVVLTELDLREELSDTFHRGESVREWSNKIGLLLPEGSIPTRDTVVSAVTMNQLGWHYVRRPDLSQDSIDFNKRIINEAGLLSAPFIRFGRLEFQEVEISKKALLSHILEPWKLSEYSPNWQRDHLLEVVERSLRSIERVTLVLFNVEENGSRRAKIREWREETGFVNIFQGRDNASDSSQIAYIGDRGLGEVAFQKNELMVQIHQLVVKSDSLEQEVLVPAIFLGNRRMFRTKP
jgi:hypothetical protein